jgi:Ca2+-binding RTX toxin-like protein
MGSVTEWDRAAGNTSKCRPINEVRDPALQKGRTMSRANRAKTALSRDLSRVETLESRRLFAPLVYTDPYGVAENIIYGRNTANGITYIYVISNGSTVASADVSTVTGLVINAGGGNDTISPNNAIGMPLTITGGTENDTIYGTTAIDSLEGSAGNDLIYGQDGNDTVLGGSGADTLYGGYNNDYIGGGDDNDTVLGDEGNDYIEGALGADSLRGLDGDDSVYGGAGNDTLKGEGHKDWLYGNEGLDLFDSVDNLADGKVDGGPDDDTAYIDNPEDNSTLIYNSIKTLYLV